MEQKLHKLETASQSYYLCISSASSQSQAWNGKKEAYRRLIMARSTMQGYYNDANQTMRLRNDREQNKNAKSTEPKLSQRKLASFALGGRSLSDATARSSEASLFLKAKKLVN
ncbi:hypothetical protein NEOLI_001981 [Neolecta irregularis DAH-3]|uniref:Uncharacterized protein n=1 Tax=Neolecta irregularis (strain DAH-3) TaxID=1198029 RepID=A0A1U7LWD3_NEOID|nr:hypothetical protein NEOLI_001981 [Neolecta irregularis DAH-3]|eukprot:OLL26977.1 hypothetical protein NEOLI_001981 [Neolecta irregularis DAH-3]